MSEKTQKPVHVISMEDDEKTLCGASIHGSVLWLISPAVGTVTCKRCLCGLKNGWRGAK